MPVRELTPEDEVQPISGPAADLPTESGPLRLTIGGKKPAVRELRPDEEGELLTEGLGPRLSDEDIARIKFMQERGAVERFGREANVGLAAGFGAPVDFANWVLGLTGLPVSEEPFLGSRQLKRGFAALGISPPVGSSDPDTLAGSMGRVTGAATSFVMPVVGLGGRAATAVQTGARAAPTTVRGAIVQDIGRAAIEAPGKFAAVEAISAAGAGTGGFIAREKFPDSPAASFIGEIVGGFTPAAAIGVAKTLPTVIGIRLARSMVRPFTTGGARIRAERRIQEAAREPERAIAELGKPEVLPEAALTPAQRAGDEGLLSLERAVIESSEHLTGQADEQIAQATRTIREGLAGFGEGVPPEKTAAALEEARNYVRSLVDTRMRIAALKADERIAALGPKATREEANLIAREEAVAARKAVNAQVQELWAAVPETVVLKTKNSADTFARLMADTPRAQQDDIPDIARKFLDPESNQAFTEAESVKELQGLRSKLLEEARKARAAGESNKARMADELADAVLADLGAQVDDITGEAGEALRSALDATAHMKQTFDRGPVGKVLAVDKRGAPITPEALTLERVVGAGGPRARVETQALLEAADTPAIRGAVEDFLLDDLQRRAVKGGRFDSKKAEAFLLRQKDVLEDFPELRTRIESAIEANDVSKLAAERAEGLAQRLDDPKISRAAVFLKEPLEDAMLRVSRAPKPDMTMREVMKQARRDPTGDALKGLKTAFGDFLIRKSETRRATVGGDFEVSGTVLKKLLEDGPVAKMAKTLFSPEEYKRLLDIKDTALKVEKAIAAAPKGEGIIADNPSLLLLTIARVAGAQIGRKVATATGGGTVQTPGIISNLAKRFVTSITRDKARHLLIDAQFDKKLYEALLTADNASPAKLKAARKQLNAWLISIGAEELEDK